MYQRPERLHLEFTVQKQVQGQKRLQRTAVYKAVLSADRRLTKTHHQTEAANDPWLS